LAAGRCGGGRIHRVTGAITEGRIVPLIDPELDFKSMVRGEENHLAIEGAAKVLLNPGGRWNPLILLGASGVGKTHLLHSLRNELERRYADLNMLILPAEEFIGECEDAARQQRQPEFRQQLWKLDVFLLDDLDRLAEHPVAQEEVYHLYNRLLADGKQLCFTSRLPPNELPTFPFPLRSRLMSGLLVRMNFPTETTLRQIIETRFRRAGYRPTRKLMKFLCKEIRRVDDVDAILRAVREDHAGKSRRVSLADVRYLIDRTATGRTTIQAVCEAVCRWFKVEPEQIVSESRRANLVRARQVAMYLARELTAAPLAEIGLFFGGRDHTTVLYACRKVAEELEEDSASARAVHDLKLQLRG
jgi:chromosomal replication initiator protein